MGVFHELAVSVFIIALGFGVCVQAGKETKYFVGQRRSWAHKVVVPLVLLAAAGAAAPFFLLPYDTISYTCTDVFHVMDDVADRLLDFEHSKFTVNLYSTLVALVIYALPVLLLPLLIPIATVKTCVARQCCAARFKQPIGELFMVTLVAAAYLVTVLGVVFPRLQQLYEFKVVELEKIPLLWQLSNTAARPVIYFLTNPAVWEGVRLMCCDKKGERVAANDDDEIEVPLSPVTTV